MDSYAADVAELVKALDPKNAIHIGHSTGGDEVIRYVARHGKGRVAKAVIIIVRAEIGYGEKVSQRLCLKKLEEGIDWATRRSGTGRPEGCRVFELERVVSCRSADPWWRTKLDFSSGEPFDDLHRSTAFRAAPRIEEVFGAGTVLFGLRLLCRFQQLQATG